MYIYNYFLKMPKFFLNWREDEKLRSKHRHRRRFFHDVMKMTVCLYTRKKVSSVR